MEFKLILKKLNNSLTEEEKVIFEKWYSESAIHKSYFDRVRTHFADDPLHVDVRKGWESIDKRLKKSEIKTGFWKYAVAASIVLILGLSVFYTQLGKEKQSSEMLKTDINPGTDKAVLTLENGLEITLEKGKTFQSDILSSDGEKLIYNSEPGSKKEIVYNYLTVPKGGQFLLSLNDGTKIWLNADSKIKYPKNFIDGVTRKVELLYGEAYFDVSPSSEHKGSKFKVIYKAQEIEVLGTEFNVKAYTDETYSYTTLVEGKVLLKNASAKRILKPSQQAIISDDDRNIEVVEVDTYDVTSWRRGIFSFKNTSLYEITKVLSRWYNVQFIYENENLKNIKYTGVLDRNHSIETILMILKTTNNIDYEINNKTVVLK